MKEQPLFAELASTGGADFSVDRLHRYHLWRQWDASKPAVMFIGLNPSKADESETDNTITRVINFAKTWGYGKVHMMNLFTYVSTNPDYLIRDSNLESNFARIMELHAECDRIIFAWGKYRAAKERAAQLTELIGKDAYCLKKNKDGSPIHPLYVKGDTKPIKFQP